PTPPVWMTFSIPQPIPSRSSHPVHAHQRPPIRRSPSSTAHPAGPVNSNATTTTTSSSTATKFSFSHLYDHHHLHSDVGDDLNLVNEEDESRVDDDDEDEDADEDDDSMEQARHDSGHYADLDLSTKGRGIPIGKPSFHFDDGHSFKKTRDHLLGHMGGSVGSRNRLSEDLHSRGRYGYGQSQAQCQSQSQSHSHSNSDSHSSVNLMANNLKTTPSLTLDTPASSLIASNLSRFRHDDRSENDNTSTPHHPVSHCEQQDHHDTASAYNVPAKVSTSITIPQRAFHQGDVQSSQPLPSRHTSEHSSDKRSSVHPAAPPHPHISIDTSKACLQKNKTPASHTTTDSLFTEALKPTGAAKTLSTSSAVKVQPEGQLALGLRKDDRVSPPSTFGGTVGLASNSSTRPLMMNSQPRHSSALPPTPMFHHQAASAFEPQTSLALLPSLSPSSPRANSALVNSLEQLSVSWKAPEHTPSFPINRLHRSRTISSGTRPNLHSSFSSNGSTHSTNPYQNSLMSPTTMVTSSSYSSLPYSPAVAFLSNFVEVTAPRMAPDEEGEQVGDFIMGKIIGHGGFSLVREAFAIHLDGMVAQVAVKIVKTQTGATDND
ncbi:hypothetical protein BGZ70_004949, partial [Mortierella alpina]